MSLLFFFSLYFISFLSFSASEKKFTAYVVEVVDQNHNITRTLIKRYSQFYTLHDKVRTFLYFYFSRSLLWFPIHFSTKVGTNLWKTRSSQVDIEEIDGKFECEFRSKTLRKIGKISQQ
jgi:hypothetical protein